VIRVTVELVPLGVERLRRTIGELEVFNDGTGDAAVGNYRFRMFPDRRAGRVLGHRRADGAWALIRQVLDQSQAKRRTTTSTQAVPP